MAEDQNPGERTKGGAEAALAATREILSAIRTHRGDEKPVFDVILENACRLCNAQTAFVAALDDAETHLLIPAWIGASDAFADGLKEFRHEVTETHLTAVQAMVERRVIRIDDIADTDTYRQGEPVRVFMVDVENIRSLATVPLLSGDRGIGSILLYRREVDPFTDDDIALIEGFAEQAVVAIENARQFREIQTRLERETATKNILRVISQSRADEAPVFDTILSSATRLCDADSGSLMLVNDARTHTVLKAVAGKQWGFEPGSDQWPLDLGHAQTEAARTGKVVHEIDLKDTDIYRSGDPTRVMLVDEVGLRTALAVPLLLGDAPIGVIVLHRLDVARAFSDSDIRLVESFASQAVIAIENVRQFREVQERLERERASAEILEVISKSRDNEKPVFDTILENTAHLCQTDLATFNLMNDEGTHLEYAAHYGRSLHTYEVGVDRWSIENSTLQIAESVREGRIVHNVDLRETQLYIEGDPWRRQIADDEGVRSFLTVPLITAGGKPIGCIGIYRKEVRAFSEDEIALVETFAEQAVIAIENVRQFRELQTRLEREAASAEILEIISQSRDDEQPVFEAILSRAERLCSAQASGLQLVTEAGTHLRTMAGTSLDKGVFAAGLEFPLDRPLGMCIAVREARVVHIEDLKDTDLYREGDPTRVKMVDELGARTQLAVPLMRRGVAFGNINLTRSEQKPFTPDEVALIETFAAQAVIAIENVRQFRAIQAANFALETRLEREAATREILAVISQSRDDEQPVFQKIVEKAAHLCASQTAALALGRSGDKIMTMGAHIGAADEAVRRFEDGEMLLDADDSFTARAILTGEVLHFPDMKDTEEYRGGAATISAMVDVAGLRSTLFVPLIAAEGPIGALILFKKEVAPYSDDQIALIETFARQAVIAIENVRQFREVQERLEREEATREILEVISRSRDDEAPVFEAVLAAAARLCDAPIARLDLANEERTHFRVAAAWGGELRAISLGDTHSLDLPLIIPTTIREGRSFHVYDLSDTDEYRERVPQRVLLVEGEGIRTYLTVPLISKGVGIGCIVLSKREVAPFSEDDIRLVHGFAAQAVIAIENVRQFREVQERLERERASAEILEVISRSRDDEIPVFDIIVEAVSRLCDAPLAYLCVLNEERSHVTIPALTGARPEFAAAPGRFNEPVESDWLFVVKSSVDGEVIRFDDLADSNLYRSGNEYRKKMVDEEGMRSVLSVPVEAGGVGYGCIVLYRREVAPFSDDDVNLVRGFAAQAVIAIENVRQFKALETLNSELGDRVDKQVGEIERMGRLKRFLPAAVADAVVTTGDESMLTSHRAMIATLFCDMRGFTAFCESAEPEETIEVLQTYHEEMGHLIEAHNGGVDQRAGDGIMVIFNDPLPCDDPAGDAVRLGLAMQAKMADLTKRWKKLGHRLGFGVGISLGYATVGMVGSAGRFDYTASGTAVNLAARLCDRAEDGEILISPRAARAVEDDFQVESVEEVELKGIREPVEIFRVIASSSR